MAATAQAIVTAEVALKYPALGNRLLLICWVGVYGISAQTAINGAAAAGYQALSDQQLDECLLEVLS